MRLAKPGEACRCHQKQPAAVSVTCLPPHDTLGIATGGFPVEDTVEDGEGFLEPTVPHSNTAVLLEKQGAGNEAGQLQEVVGLCATEGRPADDGVDGDVAGGSAVLPGLEAAGDGVVDTQAAVETRDPPLPAPGQR